MRWMVLGLAMAAGAQAQWTVQESHTTASLRGIHYVDNGVAWASGTGGTVLRTVDMGKTWTKCVVPEGAEKLDFRGVQAFDAQTAIVMSSGTGEASRLYKTVDGCETWKLVATDPDQDGFWDTLHMTDRHHGWLLGDPVDHRFVVEETVEDGERWPGLLVPHVRHNISGQPPDETGGRGAFAASNSSLTTPLHWKDRVDPCRYSLAWFGTGGPGGAKVYRLESVQPQCSDWGMRSWKGAEVPLAGNDASSGVFSIAALNYKTLVAVGGSYQKPNVAEGTAAFSTDGGVTWNAALHSPGGYRSAVAYDETDKAWITVGPNGTDVSFDDGRNWRALRPTSGEAADADKGWNALSLPFVVGEKGRIGILRDGMVVRP